MDKSLVVSSLHRPLPFLLISFASGLIVGEIHPIAEGLVLVICTFSLAILLIHILKRKRPTFFLPLTIFFLLGIQFINYVLYPKLPAHHISKFITENKLGVIGTVTKPALYLPDKMKLFVSVEKIRPEGKFLEATGLMALTVKEYEGHITLGDRIGFITKLQPIRNFNNPGGFDYKRYMASRGIWVRGYIRREEQIISMGEGKANPWLKGVEVFRTKIRMFLEDHLEFSTSGIYKALILGERSGIDKTIRNHFNRAGVGHILAISGLHMGIIAFMSFYMLRRLFLLSERFTLRFNVFKLAALFSIGPVISYAFVGGMGVSTLRATIMILALYACIIFPRQRDIYNTVALAALVILIMSPASIFNISFQLSFVSVFSIIYFTPPLISIPLKKEEDIPIKTPPNFQRKSLKFIMICVVVSLAAILGTAPLVAYHFNRISIIAILANLVIIPLIGFLALPLGLLSIIIVPISKFLAIMFLSIGAAVLEISFFMIKFFSALPFSSFRVATPTMPEIALFYALVFLLFNIKRWRWTRYAISMVILLGLLDQAYYYYRNHYSSELKVVFMDVGQGNSTLVQFPKGKNMLIDGGGFPESSFDVGERIVARFLWHRKIKNIDYLVLSHPHPDHLNGLPFIAENFNVKEFWSNGESVDTKAYHDLMGIIRRKGITGPGLGELKDIMDTNGTKIRVLYPPENFMEHKNIRTWRSLNNNSLVLKICLGDECFLFPGDIQRKAEEGLIRLHPDLTATILQAPHHGSRSSSSLEFLEKVNPRVAVFSVGLPSRFPHSDIVRRYRELGCEIYRTDRDGTITISTDGDYLRIRKFLDSG